jgi:hypothetical protein
MILRLIYQIISNLRQIKATYATDMWTTPLQNANGNH